MSQERCWGAHGEEGEKPKQRKAGVEPRRAGVSQPDGCHPEFDACGDNQGGREGPRGPVLTRALSPSCRRPRA